MRTFAIILMLTSIAGCAAKAQATRPRASEGKSAVRSDASPTTRPILYHRTGGIAGTDDRLIVWPDGFVQVDGKLFTVAAGRVTGERHAKLAAMFQGWHALRNEYLASNVADAYTITIHYGDKSVTASDLAPDLPQTFRDIFTELEAVAFEPQQQQQEKGGSEAVKP